MINTIIIALILCVIEFLVIVIASPMAKPSLVLRFLSMITAGVFVLICK